jgi:hypothetical protein
MSELNAGIVLPIISQYPEMDPDLPNNTRDGPEITKSPGS